MTIRCFQSTFIDIHADARLSRAFESGFRDTILGATVADEHIAIVALFGPRNDGIAANIHHWNRLTSTSSRTIGITSICLGHALTSGTIEITCIRHFGNIGMGRDELAGGHDHGDR